MDGQANKYVWPRLGYSSLTYIGLAVEKVTQRIAATRFALLVARLQLALLPFYYPFTEGDIAAHPILFFHFPREKD